MRSDRECGVLLHISSLPGPGGCGTLGSSARRFVDFLRAGGQSCWQMLPLTPPARGNSPYSSFSVFAGNPYFIDLPSLVREHLLPEEALDGLPEGSDTADFQWCEESHMELLRESFRFAGHKLVASLEKFRLRNEFWLPDYALFMALREGFNSVPYQEWPEQFRVREREAMQRARRELSDQILFWEYVQFLFFSQWRALRRYANARGVDLIGDMPIYVDIDSADVWGHSEVFELDKNLNPERVAGVPPDAFSENGQLWGNPLYNWRHLRRTRYKWWTERLRVASGLFDSVRIDHFRGLSSYWAIPAGAESAKTGSWQKGPGMDFIRTIQKAVPGFRLIAEDLGLLDDNVRNLLRDSGLPGMKVLQFAFSTEEESDYLPHNFIKDCVGYIGTHDNDTVQGWMKNGPEDEVAFAMDYLNIQDETNAHWDFIRGLYATTGNLVIVQMQDILGLSGDARMNKPGIPEGNWSWRMLTGQADIETAKKLRDYAVLYGRAPRKRKAVKVEPTADL